MSVESRRIIAEAYAAAGKDVPDFNLTRPGTLPAEFWDTREELKRIRAAAWSRGNAAEAVLAATLARVAADTPWWLRVPTIVGAPCGLSLEVVLLASPGVGKSSSKSIAVELTRPPDRIEPVCDDVPPGSGEGLIELLFDMVTEEDANGKRTKVKRQTRHNAFIYADEGEVLATTARRSSGNTFLPTLRTIFTGGTLGQSNAAAETKRVTRSYVYGIVIGLQTDKTGPFFADEAGGTPQRLLWASADTEWPAPDDRPDWPGRLELPGLGPIPVNFDGGHPLAVDENIAREIALNHHDRRDRAALDAHADLIRLKVAAIFAIMQGRLRIDTDDWRLAGMVMQASHEVRSTAQNAIRRAVQQLDQRYRDRAASQAVAASTAVRTRRTVEGGKLIANKVWRDPDRWTVAEMRRNTRSITEVFDEALEHAIAEGWVEEHEEPGQGASRRSLHPGKLRP